VSIEPKLTSKQAEPVAVSAIENEIPTYRAISPRAIFSLVFGALAVLSFVHPFFLLSAAIAVLLGILADRKIRKMSDVLTGREIAQAGIALGLVFGLASVTTAAVQSWVLVREASRFATTYENVVNTGSIQQATWYGQNVPYRKGKTPDEVYADVTKSAVGGINELEHSGLNELKSHLAKEGSKLKFLKIEDHGKNKLDNFATALFEVQQAGGKEPPEGNEFALAVLNGSTIDGKYEWYIEKLIYPYKAATFQVAPKPVDDGHGHAH
jgi:hypothetical protein